MSLALASRRAAISPSWVRNALWRNARAVPSLDLQFADTKSLADAISGQNLITFTRASSATYVGSDGLIKTAATNEPRFDHNPTTGESLGLLVEEQRTNLLTYSEQFDNAAWVKLASTVTGNSIAAPDGTSTADKLVSDNGAQGQITHTVAMTASTVFTYSIFAKKAGFDFLLLRLRGNDGVDSGAYFNLATGAVGTIEVNNTATIQAISDGWYRCSITRTSGSGATAPRQRAIATNADNTWSNGDGTSGVYLWGAQLEAGAFPTSYIPTTTATVTRSADVASISGSAFSSWYRQDEGTVFVEATNREVYPGFNVFPYVAQIDDGTNNNRVSLDFSVLSSGYRYNMAVRKDNIAQFEIGPFGLTGNTAKWAIALKAQDFASAVSLVPSQIYTNTTGNLPSTLNRIQIGLGFGKQFNGTIRRLSFWPQRLSNNVLQQITQ